MSYLLCDGDSVGHNPGFVQYQCFFPSYPLTIDSNKTFEDKLHMRRKKDSIHSINAMLREDKAV